MTDIISEAAKRFQQRAHYLPSVSHHHHHHHHNHQSLNSSRTEWARKDISILGPLLKNPQEHERVMIVWNLFADIFAVFDAHEVSEKHNNNNNNNVRRVTSSYLQLHANNMFNVQLTQESIQEFARGAQQCAPTDREFQQVAQSITMLAFSGHLTDAALAMESMIQGLLNVDDIALQGGGGDEGEEELFGAEERSVYESFAHLLRQPLTESKESFGHFKSAASKYLADIRAVCVTPKGRVFGVDCLRALALGIIFAITGDKLSICETIQNTESMSEDGNLWFAAALCSLAHPFANKAEIAQFLEEFPKVQKQQKGSGTNNNNNNNNNNSNTVRWFDQTVVDSMKTEKASLLVPIVQRCVENMTQRKKKQQQQQQQQQKQTNQFGSFSSSSATSSASSSGHNNNNNQAGGDHDDDDAGFKLLCRMMGAHVADLCCDLRDPSECLKKNDLIASYANELFLFDPSRWQTSLSYFVTTPLMDPCLAMVIFKDRVVNGAEGGSSYHEALRFFDEEMASASSTHQQKLRLTWKRDHKQIDWSKIFETVDIVYEEGKRNACAKMAVKLFRQQDCFVDAINLLIKSGNFTLADELLCDEVLDAFDAQNQSSVDRVVCLGEAVAFGQVLDPSQETNSWQNKQLQLSAGGGGSSSSSSATTPLTLCRKLSDLIAAQKAINVVDFLMPLLTDPGFVAGEFPPNIRSFVLGLAIANLPRTTSSKQRLEMNTVLQQCGAFSSPSSSVFQTEQQEKAALLDEDTLREVSKKTLNLFC